MKNRRDDAATNNEATNIGEECVSAGDFSKRDLVHRSRHLAKPY